MIREIKGDGSQISKKPEFLALTEDIKNWVKQHATKKYMGAMYYHGSMYILISAGRVPTRGYRIEVADIAEKEYAKEVGSPTGRECLTVKGVIKKPERLSRLQRVISYPMLLMWFDSDGNIDIRFDFTLKS